MAYPQTICINATSPLRLHVFTDHPCFALPDGVSTMSTHDDNHDLTH